MDEQDIVLQIACGAVLQALFAAGLYAWGRWVAKRQGNGRFWRVSALFPWISFACLLLGTVIGVLLLVRAFGAIATADPANKASLLAQSISEAMNASALFLIPGNVLLIASLVIFIVGTFRSPR